LNSILTRSLDNERKIAKNLAYVREVSTHFSSNLPACSDPEKSEGERDWTKEKEKNISYSISSLPRA
jgi:hypothetical protein